MPRKTYQLRDLHITKIALVRKGYRPVNDGARITIVKAQKEDTMSETKAAEASVLDRVSKAFAKMLGDPEPEPTPEPTPEPEPAPAAEPTTVDVEKAMSDIIDAKLKPLSDHLATLAAKSDEISKAQPTDDHLAEIVDEKLKPLLAKAIEDFAVAFNRAPQGQNVTKDISPRPAATNGAAVGQTIKDMDFESATRYLLHGQ
ncbi:MAG: hypothetical protein NVS4B6_23630 [Mycobacterium sp.]